VPNGPCMKTPPERGASSEGVSETACANASKPDSTARKIQATVRVIAILLFASQIAKQVAKPLVGGKMPLKG
jgi:hypothetical protein